MRSPIRRPRRPHVAVLVALAASLVLAGCSSDGDRGGAGTAAASRDVFLQPLAAPGPDPFTASTARTGAPPVPSAAPPDTPTADATAEVMREVTGSTPGLYGGTRSVASCDVEQQVAFLSGDRARSRAFAEAAGIPEYRLADWLRGLTPVVLRADTRVTGHGYRDGAATPFQSVLQTGTAVLVDRYGTPRVRCACGNPLRAPVAVQGATHRGKPWGGFRPDRVVVIRPTATTVDSLVIVNVADNTWIERKAGTDGERDTHPTVVPPCDPATCDLAGSPTPSATTTSPAPDRDTSASPDGPATPGDTAPPGRSTPPGSDSPAPSATDCPSLPPSPGDPDSTVPDPASPSLPPGCPTPTWSEPEPDQDPPSFEELFPDGDTGAQQPETFEG
ncbi:DUF6777 domain-containing protein [Streptomyces sp. NPDC047971]|uniref:DUF6777 domain-containing protein n=1 Tax=Streptomyces sp. NPDC047971 TaxID=3154499 RepID=UPI0033BFD3D3